MWSIALAIRNVFRQKRRTLLLGAALAAGVAIVTLLEAFTAGMAGSLSDKVGGLLGGEVFVTGTAASPSGRAIEVLRDPQRIVDLADGLGIRYDGITRRTRSQLLLVFGQREAYLPVEGLSAAAEGFSGVSILSGTLDLPKAGGFILIPDDTARRLQVLAGEQVIVKVSTVTGQQNVGDLVVRGIVGQEAVVGQAKGYMDIEDLNRLINLPSGSVQSLAFRLADPDTQDKVKSTLDRSFRGLGLAAESSDEAADGGGRGSGPFMGPMGGAIRAMNGSGVSSASGLEPDYVELRVSNLNDVTAQLSELADTLDLVSTGLFLTLIAIALMGLSSTFRMVMMERTVEIGALRALGMQRGRVRTMFLVEALCITLLGAIAGAALGLLSMPLLSLPNLGGSGPMSYFLRDGHAAFDPEPVKIFLNICLLVAAGALAVLPQAVKASRLPPAVALAKTS
jgi:putative ABC transport system permease protein